MKLLLPLLGVVGLGVLGLPMLVVSVVATHPWLAVGGPVQVVVPTPVPTVIAPGLPTVAIGDVVQQAETWLGTRYAFGGCSRSGIDCSCLVQLVYRAVGVNLPRVASDQFNATARLSREGLQAGDLVFFANTYMPGISHVGIYIGGGLQINAPTEGEFVQVAPVFTGYWGAHYAGAGRVRR
jgi:cell wall-associated NlpC family hydrolase